MPSRDQPERSPRYRAGAAPVPSIHAMTRASTTASIGLGTRVCLLNGFDVSVDGRSLALTPNAQRVVAFLALRERPQPRSSVAGSLWIDSSDRRASANLRTALWKLGVARHALVEVHGNLIGLASDVLVDVRRLVQRARRLLDQARDDIAEGSDESGVAADLFLGDLLPEWDEDWILFERERFRQLRVHAIEALSRQLTRAGRYAEAVDAGLAAVAADTLRESAHRVLIEAFLGEGNVADGRRQFERFRAVLWESLGLAPSAGLSRLVGVVEPADT